MDAIPWRKNRLFDVFKGTLDSKQVRERLMRNDPGGTIPRAKRFFCNGDEVFHVDNKTYVLSNQWGDRTLEAVESLTKAFPSLNIKIEPIQ